MSQEFMFMDLPQIIKQQVLYYLESNNFKAAKELYDFHLMNADAEDSKEMVEE
jgi:hypothetical protein